MKSILRISAAVAGMLLGFVLTSTHSSTVTSAVQAATPDFSISASPSSQTVTQGEATAYTVAVSGLNGFTSTVTLSVTGLPSGATSAFNPTSVTGSASSALTVYTAASTPTGNSTLIITGTTGSLTHSATVTLSVVSSQTAYYVSPSGNDSNPGTLSAPFQTLGKAQSAMQGSSIKKTYLRAGTWTVRNFNLYPSDNGETWMTYPGDAANSAILDGGYTGPSDTADVLDITGGSNITISGLQVQNFANAGIAICGGSNHCGRTTPASNANVVTNNVVHDARNTQYGGGITVFGSATNTKIYNNVVYNSTSSGIAARSNTKADNISGTDIENNVVLNTCVAYNDEGAIYLQDIVSPPEATNLTIKNNFIRDYGSASTSMKGVYLDDGISNATVTQNIIAGTGQYAVAVHQGNSNKIQGNLIDIGGVGNQQLMLYQDNSPKKTLTNMLGNVFSSNVIVNTGSTLAYAFEAIICCSSEDPTVQNDVYHNYSGGPVNYAGDPNNVPTFSDSNPVFEDPQCSGWTYTIAYGSPVFNSPVSFPGIPGIWGPPGYAIPQTGTAPSCPH